MLLMIEKRIRGRIGHAIHRYVEKKNKYMKIDNKNIHSIYLMYLDANDLYGCAISEKLPVDGFK